VGAGLDHGDHGSEWVYQYRVDLDFIRPGQPGENGYIESFNGRLRDEWSGPARSLYQAAGGEAR
jgi:transposase InsO family protein